MPKLGFLLLLCSLIFLSTNTYSLNKTITTTKDALRKLDTEIITVKQRLNQATFKKNSIFQMLAMKEKEIGTSVQRLNVLEVDLKHQSLKIAAIQTRIRILNRQVNEKQAQVAKQLKNHYALNHDKQNFARVFSYSGYLLTAEHKALAALYQTKKNLIQEQDLLKMALTKQQKTRESFKKYQQQLDKDKQHQQTLIDKVSHEIQSNQQRLSEFEKNKENLAKLIKTLTITKTETTNKPFQQMRHQLPKPIALSPKAILRMNQGLRFLCAEGTPVHAVYPGKIVFSDWLKGYGFLLIIDHGRGYMTLYSHNQALFKSKGAYVAQNEQIASVGHSGGIQEPGLYFEIRINGKPVPPLQWLSS